MQGKVRIVEVGMRDGLQNEAKSISVKDRVEFGQRLLGAGLKHLELGAFVRPDRVPQMADSDRVIEQVLARNKGRGVTFSALVPNLKGLQEAVNFPLQEVAFFTACSESFARANINCSIQESFERLKEILPIAKKHKIKVRGYVSTAFGCPYEGKVSSTQAIRVVRKLIEMGCYEVSIGDTIGVANPVQVQDFLKKLKKYVPLKKVAGHFHDTRGTALANIFAAYQLGVRVFDSSLGGLGGCPYAPGASGNVATEDVIYMFDGMKVKTGVDLKQLIAINRWLSEVMGKQLPSKTGLAGLPEPRGRS